MTPPTTDKSLNLRLHISKKLELIEEYYLSGFEQDIYQNSISLLGGRGGTILLHAQFYEATKNKKFKALIKKNVKFLIDQLETNANILDTFCTGIAGVGWLFCYLNEKRIIKLDIEEFLGGIDVYLEERLEVMLTEKNYDLLHGAMGLGIYFLKRNKHKPVENIVTSLQHSSISLNQEISWQRFDAHNAKAHIYDFGLAHGNASILHFLSLCYKKNILKEESLNLITGLLNFFMANIQDLNKVGSFFPASKLAENYKANEQHHKCRLAWCYGDLGILFSIWRVSKLINNSFFEKQSLDMLVNVALRRRNKENTQVIDAGFCHGSIGIAYIFHILYKKSKNEIFKETSEYWMEESLNQAYHTTESHGFLFHNGSFGWNKMADILTGLAGVGITYLNFLNQNLQDDWNECLFLS